MWDSLQESVKSGEVELLQRKLEEVSAELELMKWHEAMSAAAGT